MQTHYNKLVRDNISEIIKEKGDTPVYRVLTDSEYLDALNQKLHEEVIEYLEDNSIEELCDILEVAYAIAVAKGYSTGELAKIRDNKNNKRGAFANKFFLEKVIGPAEEIPT